MAAATERRPRDRWLLAIGYPIFGLEARANIAWLRANIACSQTRLL